MRETVIILDFGGQYNQPIARRVREQNVYCELLPYNTDYERVMSYHPIGIILTGGPQKCIWGKMRQSAINAFFKREFRSLESAMERSFWPICLVEKFSHAPQGEYGKTEISYQAQNPILAGLPSRAICWMSHMDYVSKALEGF